MKNSKVFATVAGGMRRCAAGLILLGMGAGPALAANIIIYGGTGNFGSRITTEALNRGHTVTVVARSAKEQKDSTGKMTMEKGDLLDTADVTKKIAGKDVFISVINSRETEFFMNAAKSAITAMSNVGPKAPRLIWIGGASSLEVAPGKRLLDTDPVVTPGSGGSRVGHTQVLDYFRTLKDVKWTFVSPSMEIRPGQRTGKFRIGGDQLLKDANGESKISIEDFAVAIIDEVEKPQQIGKRFTVGY
ncbi:MAG: NAD(P)H-binding protein [Steroidobacteraceae bacterium]